MMINQRQINLGKFLQNPGKTPSTPNDLGKRGQKNAVKGKSGENCGHLINKKKECIINK